MYITLQIRFYVIVKSSLDSVLYIRCEKVYKLIQNDENYPLVCDIDAVQ